MVSIITPSFNSEKYIDETYKSIISQTTSDWEWIIVDDGSTDNTIRLIENYINTDSRIRFFKRDRFPKGATTCRNIGIEKSKGEFLVFFDTDDILASFCIEQRASEMLKNPKADFMIFQMMIFNERVDDTLIILDIADERDNIERAIRLSPAMGGSSSVWKTESIKKIGMWDENLLMNQDIELYIRAMTGGLKYIFRLDLPPDLFYRTNLQSISREKKKSAEKQLSRAYYFGRIKYHLKNNNLFDKYSQAVKWLFLKLFFDFIFDQHPTAAKKIYKENPEMVKLLSPSYKILCKILLTSKHTGRLIIFIVRKINALQMTFTGKKGKLTYCNIKYEGVLEK